VHPEFKQGIHVSSVELEAIPGVALILGIDPKTHPSCTFWQRLANGQRRCLDEIQAAPNTGPRRFGRMVADRLHDRFPMVRPEQIRGAVDPSAQYGADKEDGELDWLQTFEGVTGVRIMPAESNNIAMRREALKKPLSELIDGAPAILLSPRCRTLISGLASGFRYRKLNVPGAVKYADEVEKNHYADMVESAEYACLTDGAEIEIQERHRFRDQGTQQRTAISEDPESGF
jgi:hypothetical protein